EFYFLILQGDTNSLIALEPLSEMLSLFSRTGNDVVGAVAIAFSSARKATVRANLPVMDCSFRSLAGAVSVSLLRGPALEQLLARRRECIFLAMRDFGNAAGKAHLHCY